MNSDEYFSPPLYVRGFILSSKQISVPQNFKEFDQLSGGQFLYIEESAVRVKGFSDGIAVTAVGYLVDTVNPNWTVQEIIGSVVSSLKVSRDAFFQRIGEIGGRYALICRDADGVFVVGDAGGARSIFYSELPGGLHIVASHSSLLANLIGSQTVSFARSIQSFGEGYRARNWPGRLSKFDRVYSLTPNTYYDFQKARPFRFFPIEGLVERSANDAGAITARLLANSSKNFEQNYANGVDRSIVVFLTGGIDSRLVSASLGSLAAKSVAFSYDIKGVHGTDISTASALAKHLDLPHFIHDGAPSPESSSATWAAKNGGAVYTSSKSVVSYCARNFSDYQYSMRGNYGEIARGVMSARTAYTDNPARFLARNWLRGSDSNEFIMEAFLDYAEHTEISKSEWPIRILAYWEHRHATWHAATLNELDIAFDTFNIMNSRNIINAMCGVSLNDQKQSNVHRKVIEIMNPDLLKFDLPEKSF